MTKTIGNEFIKGTYLKNQGKSGRELGLPKPPLELLFSEDATFIDLIKPEDIKVKNVDVLDAIEKRESIRDYSNEPITLNDLSYLLWTSQGVRRLIPNIVALRNVPSAGGRNAFETYLLINNVQGLEKGLYRYIATKHQLIQISNDKLDDKFQEAFDDQEHVKMSAVTFIWVAVRSRMYYIYGDRGYRYLFLDAGHVCQNLYLAAESINAGVCAIAHYDDEMVNNLIGVDGEELFAIYGATVGNKE